jgi:hypothetical protein
MRVISNNSEANEQKQTYIELYIPKILNLLKHDESNIVVTVECLTVIERVALSGFPSFILMPYADKVIKCADSMKGHRKRVVRKFARGVINAWS